MFDRLDPDARRVIELAEQEARAFDHHYIGTEHVLLALALAGGAPAELLTGHGCGPDEIRSEIVSLIGPGRLPAHPPEALLATLGIDLGEVRRRVESTFGSEAIARAALTAQPRRRWHGRRWWPNCTAGQPQHSTLVGGRWFSLAPRLKHVLELAATDSAPASVTAVHLLLAILGEGNGVACQILARRTVEFTTLIAAARARLG